MKPARPESRPEDKILFDGVDIISFVIFRQGGMLDPPIMQEVSIGKQLKAARLKAGMTQTQLSKAAGVSQAAIAFYENDIKSPVANKLAAIAKALGVPMEALVDPNKAQPEPNGERDNRLHGNSTAAQIQRLVLQLDREAQKILLMQAKRMLPTDPDHKKQPTKAA